MQFQTTISHVLNMNKGEDALKIVRVTQCPDDEPYGFYYDNFKKSCTCTSFTISDGSVDSLFVMAKSTATYNGGMIRNVTVLDGVFRIDGYGQSVIDEIHVNKAGTLVVKYVKTLTLLFNVCKFYMEPGASLVVDSNIHLIKHDTNVDALIDDIIHPKIGIIKNPFRILCKKNEEDE